MKLKPRQPFSLLLFLFTITGCSMIQELLPPSPHQLTPSRMRQSVLSRVRPDVQTELDRHMPVHQATVLRAIARNAANFRASFKRRLAIQSLTDPWTGLTTIEQQGLLIADLAEDGKESLPALIDVMEAGVDRTATFFNPIPFPSEKGRDAAVAFLTDVLAQAGELREKALHNLSEEERTLLFTHSRSMIEHFTPHVAAFNDQTAPQVKADWHFVRTVAEQVDYAALIASAESLTRLANDRWLHQLWVLFHNASLLTTAPRGMTGDILLMQETSYGLIVIGGTGPNTYDLDQRMAMVIDLGGDDTYRGTIAASSQVGQGNSVVIDLSGNDTYDAAPLGLATGRLGVGLLIDLSGNDVYQLGPGSGGTGFAGLGILYDGAGNDVYMGGRFTQGTAIAGLGLLVDQAGNDRYVSYGYAVGFGGPLGVGAVIDVKGDDTYQCGEKYSSNYNALDAPSAQPGDPLFQYDCFGLGTGAGKRVLTKKSDQQAYNLAGGWGLLIDIDGNDRYRSANFSQGCGYFFGIGLKLDLDGDDEHAGARYGHAAGAHFGVGLFADGHGADRYSSTGPLYNGGTAWDFSVAAAVDGGTGTDLSDFQRSSGLGRAELTSWSLFIEEGGNDRYLVPKGLGSASDDSLSGFFDLAGKDEYPPTASLNGPPGTTRGNGIILLESAGSLFVDR